MEPLKFAKKTRPSGLKNIIKPPEKSNALRWKRFKKKPAEAAEAIETKEVRAKKSAPFDALKPVFLRKSGKKGPLALSIQPRAKSERQATKTKKKSLDLILFNAKKNSHLC